MNIKTIEEAREFFKADRFATENGMRIDNVAEGRSTISLELNGSHRNAAGGVMGGVMFTMSDFACAVAANFKNKEGVFVSVDSNISFISGSRGNNLFADAKCIKSGKSFAFYEVEVKDDLGRLITKASFTMFRTMI